MGANRDLLIARYPRLFHMAERGSWPLIRKKGLLSTSSLLDVFEVGGLPRDQIESELRKKSVRISHREHGVAVVRDQCPMHISGLERCLLDGISPRQWLRTLNERVFFWVAEKRLHRLLSASNYADSEHDVLVLDTRLLVQDHFDDIELSPMNSGATRPFARPRGKSTFASIEKYPWDEWQRKRGKSGETVVELTVRGGVPDIERYVTEVHVMKGKERLETLFAR